MESNIGREYGFASIKHDSNFEPIDRAGGDFPITRFSKVSVQLTQNVQEIIERMKYEEEKYEEKKEKFLLSTRRKQKKGNR